MHRLDRTRELLMRALDDELRPEEQRELFRLLAYVGRRYRLDYRRLVCTGAAGGGIGYGREKGEVLTGPGGMPGVSAVDEARSVGRNVVRTFNRLNA